MTSPAPKQSIYIHQLAGNKSRLLILSILIPVSLMMYGQTPKIGMGVNLRRLIGNTADARMEIRTKERMSMQFSSGFMIHNELKGSLVKKDDETEGWVNNGVFSSIGLRFNTANKETKSALFFGFKAIGGYFDQRAVSTLANLPIQIHRTGWFAGLGVELGINVRISDRLRIDLGLQSNNPVYSDKQASEYFSVLPGVGSPFNVQGILSPKIYFGQGKNDRK